jgi:hypothetical protein
MPTSEHLANLEKRTDYSAAGRPVTRRLHS